MVALYETQRVGYKRFRISARVKSWTVYSPLVLTLCSMLALRKGRQAMPA